MFKPFIFLSLGTYKYSGKSTVIVSQSKNFQILKFFWGASIPLDLHRKAYWGSKNCLATPLIRVALPALRSEPALTEYLVKNVPVQWNDSFK